MRFLLQALSLAVAVGFATATMACPGDATTHDVGKADITASVNEIVLLNHEDDSPAHIQSLVSGWRASPDWDEIAFWPSHQDAGLDDDVKLLVLVDDEGWPLMDVAATGTTAPAPTVTHGVMSSALDGLEDR